MAQVTLFNLSVLNPLAESVEIAIELKLHGIHNIQIIANDFNGINYLCFCTPFVIFWVFLHV